MFAKEFGIGPTGENRLSAHTRSEKKVLLEGLKRIRDEERKQTTGNERPKGQPRESDRQMAREMKQDMEQQRAR